MKFLLSKFGSFYDGIAFAVDRDLELDRATADGAVLDKALSAAAARIDADIVLLEARRARVADAAL